MSDDDILQAAQADGAGFPESLYGRTDYCVMTKYELLKFARAIEAYTLEAHREERNKIELWRGLALCREGDGRAIAQIEKEVAAKEREACAALAESQRDSEEYGHAKAACSHIVEAIRARGE